MTLDEEDSPWGEQCDIFPPLTVFAPHKLRIAFEEKKKKQLVLEIGRYNGAIVKMAQFMSLLPESPLFHLLQHDWELPLRSIPNVYLQ